MILDTIKANIAIALNVVIFASAFTAGCAATRYVYLRIIEDIKADHAQVVAGYDREKIDRQNAVIAAQNAALVAQKKIEEERQNAQTIIENLVQDSERSLNAGIDRVRRAEALHRICGDTLPASGVETANPSGDLLDAYLASVAEVRRESIEAVRQCEIERF